MSLWTIPNAIVIVAVAGSMSLLALMISRRCRAYDSKPSHSSGKYECGFEADDLPQYVSEKSHIITMYLILELFVASILACVILHTGDMFLIKILVSSFALVISLVAKKALS